MMFSEDDLKKAVESTRQMLIAEGEESLEPADVIDELRTLAPEEFYKRVLAFALKEKKP